MRTLAALAVAVTTALVAAAPALAKELRLTVCGVDECTSLTQGPELRPLVSLAPRSAPPPVEAPFYAATLRAEGSAGVVVSFVYVPSQGAMRVDEFTSFWATVPGPLRRLLAQATEGLEPYPAPSTSGGRPRRAGRPRGARRRLGVRGPERRFGDPRGHRLGAHRAALGA